MLFDDRHLPFDRGCGLAFGHASDVPHGKDIVIAFMTQGVFIDLDPALIKLFGLPAQARLANDLGRALWWHDMDIVEIAIIVAIRGREGCLLAPGSMAET